MYRRVANDKFSKQDTRRPLTIFQSVNVPKGFANRIPNPHEVRDFLEIVGTYTNLNDRTDYMRSVGVDYMQAMRYIDKVESLNRLYYHGDSLWKFIVFI